MVTLWAGGKNCSCFGLQSWCVLSWYLGKSLQRSSWRFYLFVLK